MNIVLVKNMKLGRVYKELKSKLLGRLCDKYLIINTDYNNLNRNYNIPYYELEFLSDKKEKIFVMKDWNDKFFEIPNDDGIPQIDSASMEKNKLSTDKEKVFFIKTIQNGIVYNIDIK
uniref:Uncharacterized protein n=1 Tax=viral metagenome TaxID=1070528 RepID=A0A6C0DLK6_9ZZZZ